ncbi:hypothetical protein [Desulfothermobacter acidiphilus]|uniref:hypothetical protein n=1 Tax=Desulfothermobacter acidiphilus TaxID=1938353 RepID=UPI003F89D2BB
MKKKVSRRDFLRSLGGLLSEVLWTGEERETQTPGEELLEKKEYPAVCPFCERGCGLIFTVREGKITRLEGDPDHPANAGQVCEQGKESLRHYLEAQDWSPPLLRALPGEEWRAEGWEDALASIASCLREGEGAPAWIWRQELFSNEESYLLAQCLVRLGAVGRGGGFPLSWSGWFPPQVEPEAIWKRSRIWVWGGDLLPDEPVASVERLVLSDWFLSESHLKTCGEKVRALFPAAELYLLPLTAPWSREGSWISAGKWAQWVERAVPPRDNERSPLWVEERLWREMGWTEREFDLPSLVQEISAGATPLKGYGESDLLRRRRLRGEAWGFPLPAEP